ncbi:AMP-binding protein [Malonomonas rubra]|uniref:AMP-binding protein n=1 Tax=Malonomonas rubra TaxID=57040 RepID=UPI0026EB451C|nr:AMP-binding protein [Malonomonas rubra]
MSGQQQSERDLHDLLDIIQQLSMQLHPDQSQRTVANLDSSLDKDLGLDSLGRMELLQRLENHFQVSLSEQVFIDAEKVSDLWMAVTKSSPAGDSGVAGKLDHRVFSVTGEDVGVPYSAETLTEVLSWHNDRHPNRTHVYFYADQDEAEELTYRQLYNGAIRVASGLHRHGLNVGDPVAIMLPSSADYFFAFFGILMAGGVPVPIYPPARKSQMEEHLRRQQVILDNCAAKLMIGMPETLLFNRLLQASLSELMEVLTVSELQESATSGFVLQILQPTDTAFLQYTSGSTGNPKGVVLSHANLLANIRAMGGAIKVDEKDIIVSWLPLYHDMGLIGCWLSCLYFAAPLVLMSPFDFLSRPLRWLQAIHRFRATISAAPNFAYEICLARLSEKQLMGLDLSSWRCAFNGAEAVSADSVERFVKRFSAYRFHHEAMMPVYGMAECSVGLAFPPLGRGPVIDLINREIFTRSGQARLAAEDEKNPLQFVACGQPLYDHEIRIVDRQGRELPECQEGRIQFRGPSTCSGYYRSPEKTAQLFDGDWLDSGDLGYIRSGDVFITGRCKDQIIIAGRNIYPQELEEAVAKIKGVRKGNVVVFGSSDPKTGTERLVVLAETRETNTKVLGQIRTAITKLSFDLLGVPLHEIVLAPPQTVPKTSSGKIRRAATREFYEKGLLVQSLKPWKLYFHIVMLGGTGLWRRTWRYFGQITFAGWSWGVFCLLSLLLYLSLILLPKFSWRWAAMRLAVNGLRYLTMASVTVEGKNNLPKVPCVIVANHASYLDGFALVACLPKHLVFVAKRELSKNTLLRLPFLRLRAEFVERFDRQQGLKDARRLGQRAKGGESLMFFPEGTFTRQPGLQEFYMGAFVIAAEADLPVVPIAIRGTRSILRGSDKFPHRGTICVTIGEPISPNAANRSNWQKALFLRERSRRFIAQNCGEPDLVR